MLDTSPMSVSAAPTNRFSPSRRHALRYHDAAPRIQQPLHRRQAQARRTTRDDRYRIPDLHVSRTPFDVSRFILKDCGLPACIDAANSAARELAIGPGIRNFRGTSRGVAGSLH